MQESDFSATKICSGVHSQCNASFPCTLRSVSDTDHCSMNMRALHPFFLFQSAYSQLSQVLEIFRWNETTLVLVRLNVFCVCRFHRSRPGVSGAEHHRNIL